MANWISYNGTSSAQISDVTAEALAESYARNDEIKFERLRTLSHEVSEAIRMADAMARLEAQLRLPR